MLRRYLALQSSARGDDPIVDDLIQLNCIYKNKLFEHFYRWVTRSEPSAKLASVVLSLRRRHSGRRVQEPPYGYGDCASCMMVETGEKASQAGARSLG